MPDAPTPTVTDPPTPDANVKTVGNPSKGHAWACPATEEQFNAMVNALVANDDVGYRQATGDGVALVPGDKVRILARTFTTVHLRVLTGDNKDRDCWAPGDVQNLLQD